MNPAVPPFFPDIRSGHSFQPGAPCASDGPSNGGRLRRSLLGGHSGRRPVDKTFRSEAQEGFSSGRPTSALTVRSALAYRPDSLCDRSPLLVSVTAFALFYAEKVSRGHDGCQGASPPGLPRRSALRSLSALRRWDSRLWPLQPPPWMLLHPFRAPALAQSGRWTLPSNRRLPDRR